MATLPDQAQADLDAANAIEQAMIKPPEPDPEAPPTPEPVVEPPPPAPEPPPPLDDDSWKAKYLTLQGMHRADVNRLTTQCDDLKAQVTDLTSKLAAAPKAPAEAPKPASKLVTDKDAEEFGPELIDLIGRKAQEIADASMGKVTEELAAVKAENATLKGTVDTVTETESNRSRRQYFANLTSEVPDYETVNTNPAWLAWLLEKDLISGAPRQAHLDSAFEAMDAPRTAILFNAFKATQAPAPAPAAPPTPPADDLSSQITPGSTRGHVPDAKPTATTWTPAAMDKFFKDLVRGEYKGREAEADRINAEIDRFLAAG